MAWEHFALLLIAPVGTLAIAGAVFWFADRKPHHLHPGE